MKVILLKDVPGTGVRGEVKNISDGYAVNFLLPRSLAVLATKQSIERLKIERSKDEGEKKIQNELLDKNIKTLSETKITIKAKANDSGHLFAGLHKGNVLTAIESQTKIRIPEEVLNMEGVIKETGEHKIPMILLGKESTLNLVVETS